MSLDLDAIKARLAKACPGPWIGMTFRRPIDGNCYIIVRGDDPLVIAATLVPQYGDNDTAVMLLHSRADMDALVSEVERLRGERAAVVAWLRRMASVDFCALRVKEACATKKWAELIERGEHRREEEP